MPLARPPDYVPPPRPGARDVMRTLGAVATDLLPSLLRLALHRSDALQTTNTAEGLPQVRQAFARTLRLLGIDLEVLHPERVPATGGLVLMWNQESHLDHPVLGAAIPRHFFCLYNNAIARFPFYGTYMRTTGHVHVDREDEEQWRASIALAARRVHDGECVLVSPEGTRSWDGRLLPMKRGAFILAASSQRPIVCVTVIGGHERLPRGSAVVRGGRVRVVFAEPIATNEDEAGLAKRIAGTFERVKAEHAL